MTLRNNGERHEWTVIYQRVPHVSQHHGSTAARLANVKAQNQFAMLYLPIKLGSSSVIFTVHYFYQIVIFSDIYAIFFML